MKIAVGISGGVDSALAAALLKEQGYQVTGVFLECWNKPGCRTDDDRKDALGVALKLKIPFKVLDFKKEYQQKVLDKFYREYKAGRTPNPDIVCNQEIKFGLFLKWAMKNKFDYVATGHYARIVRNTQKTRRIGKTRRSENLILRKSDTLSSSEFSEIELLQSEDRRKDQTYFLAMLKQEQLRRVLFPIGHLKKSQVRQEAKKRGLKVWNKKDSSGICFIGHDLNFREFLKRKIKEHEGEVVDKKGKVIGKHRGFEFYTIGQGYARPLFVIGKDILRNRLIVGRKSDLAKKEFAVEGWSWIGEMTRQGRTLTVRIRHQGRLIPCQITGKKVFLKQAEQGIAPGQAAVIYHGVECLGGGVMV